MPHKPASAHTKRLRAKPFTDREIEIEHIPPACPRSLSKGARKYWKQLAPSLVQLKKLSHLTAPSFANLCRLLDKVDELAAMTEGKNLLVEVKTVDGTGTEITTHKESPLSCMYRQYSRLTLDHLKKWDLTPDEMHGVYRFADPDDEEITLT